MHQSTTIPLVQGARRPGSSSRNAAIGLLQSGQHVTAVELPHTAHANNVLFARQAIDAIDAFDSPVDAFDSPLVVSVRSNGAMVMSDATQPNPKVTALDFLPAFASGDGERLPSSSRQVPPRSSAAHIAPDGNDGFSMSLVAV